MEKPINVIDNGSYVEPNNFESDQESILFHAYLEQLKYIEFLENQVNNTNN